MTVDGITLVEAAPITGAAKADSARSDREVLKVMAQLAREGATMIVVTHEMACAREAADAVHFMGSSNLIEIGPPSQVLDRPSDPRTRQFLERFPSSPNRVPRQ